MNINTTVLQMGDLGSFKESPSKEFAEWFSYEFTKVPVNKVRWQSSLY